MFSLTQSFLDAASGVGTNDVARSPKSPGSTAVLVTREEGGCRGGLVLVEVGTTLIFSTYTWSRKSVLEEEVLRVEFSECASEWTSN